MAVTSEAELCNLALSHIAVAGVTFEIQDLDTEVSKEAQACRDFFTQTRDEVLRDFPWPFASVVNQALALVTDYTLDPTNPTNSEWCFAYQYPTDCLTFRRILSGDRNDSRQTRVPYRIAQNLIYTDMLSARGEWTTRITDVTQFAPDFVQAFALKLAFYIGPRITGGDQYKLADRAGQMYAQQLRIAQANAVNEEQVDEERDSSFILGR